MSLSGGICYKMEALNYLFYSHSHATPCRIPRRSLGLSRGDRLLLVFLPSLDFIVAFIACLRAGVIAVPVYPPDPRKAKAHVGAFASIARSSGAAAVLTHPAYERIVSLASLKDTASRLLGSIFGRKEKAAPDGAPAQSASTSDAPSHASWPDELKWHSVDPLGTVFAGSSLTTVDGSGLPELLDDQLPAASSSSSSSGIRDTVAFLQYTSGSTAEPKGVMITHANLAHNLRTIVTSLEAGTDTVVVSWLPQYHDMGLIGSYPGTLYCGGSGAYMSPVSFIKRPVGWLEAVHRYRGTHLQSPNFGYALSARKWREQPPKALASASLDLSCVRHMFNAAEPITTGAMADFLAVFSPFGLSPAAMKPGYGLAEHTVYVSDGGGEIVRIDKLSYETHGAVVVKERIPVTSVAAAGTKSAAASEVDVVACGSVAGPHVPAGTPTRNPDVIVVIMDAASRQPVPAGHTGEVWISSPSAAAGYWGKPELSLETFGATLQLSAPAPSLASDVPASIAAAAETTDGIAAAESASSAVAAQATEADTSSSGGSGTTAAVSALHRLTYSDNHLAPRRFLRSGDIGFILDGQLFISGRMKDLLIVRGRNYFPQDIEGTIEGDARVRPGCTAAFQAWVPSAPPGSLAASADGSTNAGSEGVVIATELRDSALPLSDADAKALTSSLRASVMRDHGLALSAILLLKPHAARKTTSGKIARRWNQRAFQSLVSPPSSSAEPSPWSLGPGPFTNVIHLWLAPAAAADVTAAEEEWEEEASGGGEPAVGSNAAGDATTAAIAGASGAAASTRASAPDAELLVLSGPALQARLMSEIAALLKEEPASIDPLASLQDLGMDSLLLTQFAGMLQHEYGFRQLRDELMFADSTSVAWLTANAQALRADVPLPEGLIPSTVARATASGAEGVTSAALSGDSGAAAAGTGAAGTGAAADATTKLPVEGGPSVVEVGLMPPRRAARPRQKQSWFEANCPCCMFCW